jgi:hypothetical protein
MIIYVTVFLSQRILINVLPSVFIAVDSLWNIEKKMVHNLMVLRVSWNLTRCKHIQPMTSGELFNVLRFIFVGKTSLNLVLKTIKQLYDFFGMLSLISNWRVLFYCQVILQVGCLLFIFWWNRCCVCYNRSHRGSLEVGEYMIGDLSFCKIATRRTQRFRRMT